MDQQQFDKIWEDVQRETANRSQGSFKRALWYGNNSQIFGQNKGLRKVIRNAPKMITLGALGALNLPPGLSDLVDKVTDEVLMTKAKEIYSEKVKPLIRGNPPQSVEEAIRRNIKHEVKKLESEAFQVIDRNLVKLRDAKNKVGPSVHDLMSSLSSTGYTTVPSNVAVPTDEVKLQKAHNALRALAETEYYIDKLMRLTTTLQSALKKVSEEMNNFKKCTLETHKEVEDYIKEYL